MGEEPRETLDRVYALNGPEDAADAYDEWAATYDEDTIEGLGYVGHTVVADKLATLGGVERVLDAGCGSGLVGAAIAERMEVTIDGVDISTGMLDRAGARGAYRTLETADLTQPLAFDDHSYDAVVCAGTFTAGHVGPEAFTELVRVTRPGGHVVATVLGSLWEAGGYRAHLERLESADVVRVRETAECPYREAEGVSCRLVVLEVS